MIVTSLEYHVIVTLPLWVLSVTFPKLLVVALTSLLLPIGVSIAAGAQATLPKDRQRWWSRPLVALLFFLQPIVRGWQRYQGRLELHRAPESSRETLDSVTLRDSTDSLGVVGYWAEKRLERIAFVSRIVQSLDRRGWANRTDIGWSEFDVEVYGNRWSVVQLLTVAEDHPNGRQLLRCRLRARWSPHAKVVFWLLVALESIVVGYFGGWLTWLAMLLLTLPLLAYYLHRQKRNQQSLLIVFLDGLAKELGLIKVPGESALTNAKAAAPVDTTKSPFKATPEQPPVSEKAAGEELPNRA
jgi:hypothetical protein